MRSAKLLRMRIGLRTRAGTSRAHRPRSAWTVPWVAAVLPALLLGAALGQTAATDEDGEEIEVERTVTFDVRLLDVERVPVPGSLAIARYRVMSGSYRGATFSLAYDYERPVRLRSWDVHDASGYQRIGGARIRDAAPGQWDALLLPDSYLPVEEMTLTLIQHDLNEDEENRRWHFTAIESIVLPGLGMIFGPEPEEDTSPLPPDR